MVRFGPRAASCYNPRVFALSPRTYGITTRMTDPLETRLGTLVLKNPLLSASGTFGYGEEMEAFVDPALYGGIIGKSISVEPRRGNPLPRVAETPSGMLNSIGLQNPGIDAFIAGYLPRMRKYGTVLVVNLVGDTVEEYVSMAERLDVEEGVDALELNISCPNCPAGGMEFGIDPAATERLVRRVRDRFRRFIIAKLTPNVTDIVPIAQAAEEGGADALSLVNTYRGMAVDWRKRRPRLGGVSGGLSGPAIKPLALHLVWQVARSCRAPVIGIGGIANADDVLEFLVAGASAVQLGTVQFIHPRAVLDILKGLREAVAAEALSSLSELVGTLEVGSGPITVESSRVVENLVEGGAGPSLGPRR
jgi:dihydroorotate dehydrogenase (NAD+) catalytic subunit